MRPEASLSQPMTTKTARRAREIAGQTTRAAVLCGLDFGGLAPTCDSRMNDYNGADSRHG